MRQQHLVHLAQQAGARRQPSAQLLQATFERCHAAADHTTGGSGGSGIGTKAWNGSPAVVTVT